MRMRMKKILINGGWIDLKGVTFERKKKGGEKHQQKEEAH